MNIITGIYLHLKPQHEQGSHTLIRPSKVSHNSNFDKERHDCNIKIQDDIQTSRLFTVLLHKI